MLMNPEKNYVLSTLRWPGEDASTVLSRFWDAGWVEPDEIQHPLRRQLLTFVQTNAADDVATSPMMAAQFLGMDVDALTSAMEGVDPSAARLYAELVLEQRRSGQIRTAVKRISQSAGLSSDQMLDELQRELTHVRLAREDRHIVTVDQSNLDYLKFLRKQQGQMAAGIPRVCFNEEQTPTLNKMVPYLFPGNMVLVTAKTKRGKSSLCQAWFDHLLRRGFKSIYFHFEDPPEVMGLKRMARQMAYAYKGNEHIGISFTRMLTSILREQEQELIQQKSDEMAKWAVNGTQVHCADWEMAQVVRVWQRLSFAAGESGIPVVFIDYLNKAHVGREDLKHLGIWESRARDAEVVKSTAEKLGTIVVLVQQEGDTGQPFQTRQAAQKAQVRISLRRERLGESEGRRLSPVGQISVMDANLGATGDVGAEFLGDWMLWVESGIIKRQ